MEELDPAWHWGRFFRVRTEHELEQLAMSSPTPKQASDALWWVSNDPNSRQLAEMREMSERAHRHTMAATREEGRIEGREEGFTEGLRVQIRSLAKVLNIELTAQKQE